MARVFQSFAVLLVYLFILSPASANNIKVYAAASMTDALTQIAQDYKQFAPHTTINFSFAGSSTLAKQIENGAPADIFISADQDWIDYLLKRKPSTRSQKAPDKIPAVTLVSNELVLVAPKVKVSQSEFDENISLAAQLSGRLCTGDPDHVPAGKYAKQALQHLGWWDAVKSKLIGAEDVRTALAFVERGECSMGIVYKTDAGLSERVKIIYTFPTASHSPIRYPALLINTSRKDAEAFWHYLQGPKAADVFNRYGFTASTHD